MGKRVLLTGAGGFIGAHCVEYFLDNTDWEILALDSFRHKGTYRRLDEIENYNPKRVKVFRHDLAAPIDHQLENLLLDRGIGEEKPIDYIINMASESAVERSTIDPGSCVRNNVELVISMLEFARKNRPELFLQVSCYDTNTRVLTSDGFKSYDEIILGQKILSFNSSTRIWEEKEVLEVIVQDYEGEMYHYSNGRVDLKVTPNHRMIYETESGIKERRADSFSLTGQYSMPLGKWVGKKDSTVYVDNIGYLDTGDLFYLCGLFLGDGFTAYQEKLVENKTGLSRKEFLKRARSANGRFMVVGRIGKQKHSVCKAWRIWFDIPENDPARSKLLEVLSRFSIAFSEQNNTSGEHVYFTSEPWLKFFEQFGSGAKNKSVPSWMLEYDAVYLERLFEGLIDSDGRFGGSAVLSTSSTKLLRDAIEIGLKIGYAPHYILRKSSSQIDGRQVEGEGFMVTFCKTRPTIIRERDLSVAPYKGKVWCLKVADNRNMVVERNGRICLCGNTDEVYGEATSLAGHKEWSTILPSNPYAASKAAQEALVIAYWRTYDLPIVISNCMNIIGERQDPEKFLPKLIQFIATGQEMPIYADSEDSIGSRVYLHAKNKADALIFITDLPAARYSQGADRPDRYNICGEDELDNLEMGKLMAKIMGKELKYRLVPSESARPGYDRRYALDGSKLSGLGWKPPMKLEESLKRIAKWTVANPHWLL